MRRQWRCSLPAVTARNVPRYTAVPPTGIRQRSFLTWLWTWCGSARRSQNKYCILPYFWVPEETLDLRVKRDHVPYDIWERQGYLETTEGNVIHYGYIEKFIENLGERFNIREIALNH